jgi:acyl carrier protein
MQSIITAYISRELISNPDLLPLREDTPLLETGILDSLAVLRLVLYLEEQFGVVVAADEVIPENFETVKAICRFLRTQHQVQEV